MTSEEMMKNVLEVSKQALDVASKAAVKVNGAVKEVADEDATVQKRDLMIAGAICVLIGIVIGILIAPKKKCKKKEEEED